MAKLNIRVNRKKPESLTKQIADQLGGLIRTGVLEAGSLLPSERTLAETLGVARNVVRGSYEYLTSGGQIESEGRKGRRVRSTRSGKKSSHATASGKKGGGKASKKSSTSKKGSSRGRK